MERHIKVKHGLSPKEAGAYTEVDLSGEIEAGIAACFGSLDQIPAQTKTCR